jgi:hypothetical protein
VKSSRSIPVSSPARCAGVSEPTHSAGAFKDDQAFLLTGVQVQGRDGAGKLERVDEVVTPQVWAPGGEDFCN